MKATEFEFRHRFWIIAPLFALAFFLYRVDHVNAARAIAAPMGGDGARNVHLILGAGAVLVLLAAALRTWAAAYLRTAVVKDRDLHAERVVADGPYRHLRNPLYLGTILLAVGFAPLASRLGAAALVVLMVVFVLRLIGREEAELERAQGERYLSYRRAVPSLVPSLAPRLPASGAAPEWGQAIAGELAMWIFGAGALIFAVTFAPRVLWAFVIAGFVGYLPGRWRAR